MTGKLPPSASVATALDGDKLCAPSAERNAAALTDLIVLHAPPKGSALELASGTGQHVVGFARATPDLTWQPTDIDPARLASINAYVRTASLPNLEPALKLDATQTGWAQQHPGRTLIVVINLLHLISDGAAQTVVSEAMAALAPGGVCILYGPFKRGGALTSAGDLRFDTELRATDSATGYKDDEVVSRWLTSSGASHVLQQQMPANNLGFVATRA